MRSLVEYSKSRLKSAPHGDIDNTAQRSDRGYAAIYLALTFAVVASNLKRIVTFLVAASESFETDHTTGRAQRRKDTLGRPRPKPLAELPPGH